MKKLGKRSKSFVSEFAVARVCWCYSLCDCYGAFEVYKNSDSLQNYLTETSMIGKP